MGDENKGLNWKQMTGGGAVALGSVVALVSPSAKALPFLSPVADKLADITEHVPVLNKIENPTYRLAAIGVPVAIAGGLALLSGDGDVNKNLPNNGKGRGGNGLGGN